MTSRARTAAMYAGLGLVTAAAWVVGGMIGCEAGGASFPEGGSGPTTSAGGNGTGGLGPGGSGFDAGDQDGSLEDAETCLQDEAQAQKVPLDVFFVVDRSGSMGSCTSGSWPPTENALREFFADPLSAGISVGMNFFPALNYGSDDCLYALYNPVQVPEELPLPMLPDDVAVLTDYLDAMNPSDCTEGMTPMYGALYGTYQAATAYQQNNPTHKVIVVVSGDGEPTSCDYTDIPTIAALAASARGGGVYTYAIIIDSSAAQALDQIAEKGGTLQAYDVSTDVSQFAQVLDEIRATELGCEYSIPDPEEGVEFDPLKLNVIFTPSGDPSERIPQAASENDCGSDDGWYYDDPDDPTKIIFCPHTCFRVQSDSEANVSLEFGCPTEVN